jgi:hypothetical protein
MQDVQTHILDHIRQAEGRKVFTSKDFLDFGGREAVDQALSRLARAGTVLRLVRGLYYFPRNNPRLGIPLPPDIDEIAEALGRKTGSRVAPSGAVAANRLGLSTQVPAKPVYLTDGRSRQVRVGNLDFVIRHAPPKELPPGSRTSALVFQALRHVGRDAVDDEVIARLRRSLTPEQRAELLRDAKYTTGWIAEVIRQVGSNAEETAPHG